MSAEDIGYQAESTAQWRRSKAIQFPEDTRNLRAAEELERLAREIEALAGSKVYEQINDAEESLLEACEVDDNLFVNEAINEAVSAELRSVGFHGDSDGAQFLEWYRDLVREKLREALAPEPDDLEVGEGGAMNYKGRELVEIVVTQAAFEALFTGRPIGLFEFRPDGDVSLWVTREYGDKLCNVAGGQNTISDAILQSAQIRDLPPGVVN